MSYLSEAQTKPLPGPARVPFSQCADLSAWVTLRMCWLRVSISAVNGSTHNTVTEAGLSSAAETPGRNGGGRAGSRRSRHGIAGRGDNSWNIRLAEGQATRAHSQRAVAHLSAVALTCDHRHTASGRGHTWRPDLWPVSAQLAPKRPSLDLLVLLTLASGIIDPSQQTQIQGVGAGSRAHPWDGGTPFKRHHLRTSKHQSLDALPH